MQKILVVDDEPDIVEMVGLRLKSNNFEVITAQDGEQAVEQAQQHRPDLILMDIMMPKMLGGDAVKLLRNSVRTKNIPIIFFTGAYHAPSTAEDGEAVVNVGGRYYPTIGKPFDPNRLLAEIRKHLKPSSQDQSEEILGE